VKASFLYREILIYPS